MKKQKVYGVLACIGLMAVSATSMAQTNAREAREESLQASRYEQVIGKLQQQNDDLRSDIRALQRTQATLQRAVEETQAKMQHVADETQKLGGVDVRNLASAQRQLGEKLTALSQQPQPWGDGQRDCTDIGVKHQHIKAVVKPDGSRGVKFLCFDGKVLHLGSEIYTTQDEGDAAKGR